MRRLLILRHAKAVAHSSGGDRARELAQRGRRDAGRLGAYMAREKLTPDLALVSPAARTRETIALVMAEWPVTIPVQIRESLYLAEAPAILAEVRAAPSEARALAVVGHNPGLAEFALALAVRGAQASRMRMIEGFPTCALAIFDLDIESWRDASFHTGQLGEFITPDQLSD